MAALPRRARGAYIQVHVCLYFTNHGCVGENKDWYQWHADANNAVQNGAKMFECQGCEKKKVRNHETTLKLHIVDIVPPLVANEWPRGQKWGEVRERRMGRKL